VAIPQEASGTVPFPSPLGVAAPNPARGVLSPVQNVGLRPSFEFDVCSESIAMAGVIVWVLAKLLERCAEER
jgi:hypothetical protein